jgi:hypothetical protein
MTISISTLIGFVDDIVEKKKNILREITSIDRAGINQQGYFEQ